MRRAGTNRQRRSRQVFPPECGLYPCVRGGRPQALLRAVRQRRCEKRARAKGAGARRRARHPPRSFSLSMRCVTSFTRSASPRCSSADPARASRPAHRSGCHRRSAANSFRFRSAAESPAARPATDGRPSGHGTSAHATAPSAAAPPSHTPNAASYAAQLLHHDAARRPSRRGGAAGGGGDTGGGRGGGGGCGGGDRPPASLAGRPPAASGRGGCWCWCWCWYWCAGGGPPPAAARTPAPLA